MCNRGEPNMYNPDFLKINTDRWSRVMDELLTCPREKEEYFLRLLDAINDEYKRFKREGYV